MSVEMNLLEQAKEEDIEILIKLLKLKNVNGKDDLINYVSKYMKNDNYRNTLCKLDKHYKLKNSNKLKNHEIENEINKKIIDRMKNASEKKFPKTRTKYKHNNSYRFDIGWIECIKVENNG